MSLAGYQSPFQCTSPPTPLQSLSNVSKDDRSSKSSCATSVRNSSTSSMIDSMFKDFCELLIVMIIFLVVVLFRCVYYIEPTNLCKLYRNPLINYLLSFLMNTVVDFNPPSATFATVLVQSVTTFTTPLNPIVATIIPNTKPIIQLTIFFTCLFVVFRCCSFYTYLKLLQTISQVIDYMSYSTTFNHFTHSALDSYNVIPSLFAINSATTNNDDLEENVEHGDSETVES